MFQRLFTFVSIAILTVSAGVADGQLIVAHRGASHDAPENTLAAFQLAWQQQADAIEGDFYLTKDGQIVCIHDRTTKRVAEQQPELTVADSTLNELRQLDVGSWKAPQYNGEKIPTLSEVLATVPAGKQIFVEIKCGPEILPVLQPQLAESGLQPQQIVIICFNEEVIRLARQQMPEYKANWLTSYKQQDDRGPWKPGKEQVLTTLQQCQATGLGTQAKPEVVDQAFATAVQQAGTELHVWTVNEPDMARYFAELGVRSITTDRPALIREALQPVAAGN